MATLTTLAVLVVLLPVVTLTRTVTPAVRIPVALLLVRWVVHFSLQVVRTVTRLVVAVRATTQVLLVLVQVPTGALFLLGHRRFKWLSIL
jgi:hypothetical protein